MTVSDDEAEDVVSIPVGADGQVNVDDLPDEFVDGLLDGEGEADPECAALFAACEAADLEQVVHWLGSMDVNVRGDSQDTPLHIACLYGSEEVALALMERGADVQARDEDMSTPLHDAAAGGYLELVRTLIGKGAEVSAQDNDGDTPLHNAANGGHETTVKLLLEHQADVTLRNQGSRLPCQIDGLYVDPPETQQAIRDMLEERLCSQMGTDSFCRYCLRTDAEKLSACSRCRARCYCSADCQRKDWSGHKLECKVLAKALAQQGEAKSS